MLDMLVSCCKLSGTERTPCGNLCGNVFCSVWDLILPQADVNQSRWMADMCLWAPWVYLGDASTKEPYLYRFIIFINLYSCSELFNRFLAVAQNAWWGCMLFIFWPESGTFRCSAGACPAILWEYPWLQSNESCMHCLWQSTCGQSILLHLLQVHALHAKDSCERICQRVRGWNLEGIRWYKHVRWTLATARDSGWIDYCERSESIGMYRDV